MKKIFTFKRIILVVLLIIGILFTILNINYLNSYGVDCTKEYTTFKQVSSIQDLKELRSKLQELNIEYSIKNSTLAIKNNTFVSFDIKSDDTCCVSQNDFIKSFKKLDEEDRTVVEIHGILEDGKIKERITFEGETEEYLFTKIDNKYYAKAQTYPVVIILIGTGLAAICFTLLIIDIVISFKKRKTQKIPTIQ